jgi:hypothetical protein
LDDVHLRFSGRMRMRSFARTAALTDVVTQTPKKRRILSSQGKRGLEFANCLEIMTTPEPVAMIDKRWAISPATER